MRTPSEQYRIKAETEGFSDIQEVYIGGGEPSSVTFTLHENAPGNGGPGNGGPGNGGPGNGGPGNGDPDPVASQAPLLMGGALIVIGVVTLDPDRMNAVFHRIISSLGLVR